MDFGKLSNVERVDFSLPEMDPRSLALLGGQPRSTRIARVGMPVWAQKRWVGTLYPKGTPAREFVGAYGKQFGTIELNSTHYGIPDPANVDRWREAVPAEFRFCPKVLQEISHRLGEAEALRLLPGFCAAVSRLRPRLGVTFLQLPPSFSSRELPALRRFLEAVPSGFPLAVEFRHESWFTDGRLIEPAFDLLASSSVATVITDVSGRRDVSHSTLTAPRVLIRFVGNLGHRSDAVRAAAWAERVSGWFAQGLEDLYFFVHQPEDLGAPELANEFIRALNARGQATAREVTLNGGSDQMSLL